MNKKGQINKKILAERTLNSLDPQQKIKLNKEQAEEFVTKFLEEIKKSLINNEEIKIQKYFNLKTDYSKERNVINFQTKEKIIIPSKRVPKIIFSKELKSEIAK